MGAQARLVAGSGVIADENRGIDVVVDSGDHSKTPRPRSNDAHIRREVLDQKVLAVAMGVGDDDFRRTGASRRFNCSERFARHELAEPPVLEARRPELIGVTAPATPSMSTEM